MNKMNPNWSKLINELVDELGTLKKVAELARIKFTTLSNLRGGVIADPSYSRGYRIIQLHERYVK